MLEVCGIFLKTVFEADLEKFWLDAGPKGAAEEVDDISDLLVDRRLTEQL